MHLASQSIDSVRSGEGKLKLEQIESNLFQEVSAIHTHTHTHTHAHTHARTIIVEVIPASLL